MKGQRDKGFRERMAELFDLPGEVVAGLSSITLTGDSRVYIDRHNGILEYGDRRILLRCGKRITVVEGSGLEILAMSARELIITGKISGVSFGEVGL